MNVDFTGKHVVITGGTGALGSAVTRLLLDSGARCSIPCYNRAELDGFEWKEEEKVFLEIGVDLVDEDSARDFYRKAVDANGALWASIHIAGGFAMGPIGETGKEAFMQQVNMNLVTCYNATRAALQHMRAAGEGGRVVNVAARPALEPRQGAGMSAYTSSKAAVAALTQSVAAEVAEEEILVNAVAPSVIDTPANRQAMPEADYDRWPKPAEIGAQMLYLASPQNRVTRGGIVPVYGQS